MRIPRKPVALCCAIVLAGTFAPAAMADDGFLVRKSMSHDGNEKLPPGQTNKFPVENEHAFIDMMEFYVPIQQANGTVLEGVEYMNIDGNTVDTRDYAKPLVGVYINGQVETFDGIGFVGHGTRDAWASVSLDDGVTWKNTNLSESADESSSDVERRDVKLFKDTKYMYPGDVVNVFHAVAGENVLVAWPSRYCSSGQPNYSLDQEDPSDEQLARRTAIADYLGIDLGTASADDLYLIDMFGVGGKQGSVDYAEDRWPQNQVVGEVPYNCLWTARGQLVAGNDPRTEAVEQSYMRWFKAERLTSGRRDVNRIEARCDEGAGCAITWQEDPDGLRAGQGLGPGGGWSGATANSQTDIWYSYIDWDDFNVVQDPADDTGATPMTLADYELAAEDTSVTQKPKPFVPFAMPMRMTDNAKCNTGNPQPYCYGTALDGVAGTVPEFPAGDGTFPMDYGLRDMCYDIVQIETGPNNELGDICVSEDGLPLVGNTASTRPRLNLFGYDSDADDVADSAFAVVITEEDKGLGRFGFPTDDLGNFIYDGGYCDPESADDCVEFDIGKNIWYHSFGMSLVDDYASDEYADDGDGLPANLGDHGNMLNQPEINWQTGEMFLPADTQFMWDFGDYNYEIYNTEIARRGSMLAQGITKAQESDHNLIALPTWKQGIMNQGGPADVMSRRILVDDSWVAGAPNPYAFRNMDCPGDDWLYAPGDNAHYPDGLCGAPALNTSGAVADTCTDSQDGGDVDCPLVVADGSTYGSTLTNPVLQGREVEEPNTTKVLSWHQCQPTGEYTDIDGSTQTCPTGDPIYETTLDDQSWVNPLDVAKGHRGFLDGDFVMMLYAWSPNWRLNTVGNDRYELYIRRSFDGAATWTTTPADGTASDGVTPYGGDGTVTCETYRDDTQQAAGELDEPRVCTEYAAGAPEQARNVTQHKSMRITTLDPRYTPTGASITDAREAWGIEPPNYGDYSDGEDVRDPSRYFIVYETGDNSTVEEGEAEPLDLFYSRAIAFGDHYAVWAEETDLSVCYPSDPHDQDVPEELIGSGFCNEFDRMEQGIPGLEASEASLTANPGGEFLYGAWAQALHEVQNKNKETVDSDAMARRMWWIDDYISADNAWDFGQGTGDGVSPN